MIALILLMHYLFDWVLQTRWQAENKSKNWEALSRHVLTYSLGLSVAGIILFNNLDAFIVWVLVNTVAHFVTDAVTSRMSTKFYGTKNFWNVIGGDQMLHYLVLFYSYGLLVQW